MGEGRERRKEANNGALKTLGRGDEKRPAKGSRKNKLEHQRNGGRQEQSGEKDLWHRVKK